MPIETTASVSQALFNWTLERYQQAIDCGILTEEDQLELLSGNLVTKMPVNVPHSACVKNLNRYFTPRYFDSHELIAENPVALPAVDSQPEPDYVIARLKEDNYLSGHPTVEDIFLLIEVSDSTLARDRTYKAAIYAAAGVSEYWIINLKENQVEVHTQPTGERYGLVSTHARGTTFESPFNGLTVVDELFPG